MCWLFRFELRWYKKLKSFLHILLFKMFMISETNVKFQLNESRIADKKYLTEIPDWFELNSCIASSTSNAASTRKGKLLTGSDCTHRFWCAQFPNSWVIGDVSPTSWFLIKQAYVPQSSKNQAIKYHEQEFKKMIEIWAEILWYWMVDLDFRSPVLNIRKPARIWWRLWRSRRKSQKTKVFSDWVMNSKPWNWQTCSGWGNRSTYIEARAQNLVAVKTISLFNLVTHPAMVHFHPATVSISPGNGSLSPGYGSLSLSSYRSGGLRFGVSVSRGREMRKPQCLGAPKSPKLNLGFRLKDLNYKQLQFADLDLRKILKQTLGRAC